MTRSDRDASLDRLLDLANRLHTCSGLDVKAPHISTSEVMSRFRLLTQIHAVLDTVSGLLVAEDSASSRHAAEELGGQLDVLMRNVVSVDDVSVRRLVSEVCVFGAPWVPKAA